MTPEKFEQIKSQYTAEELTVSYAESFLRGIPLTLPPVAVCLTLNFIIRGFPKESSLREMFWEMLLNTPITPAIVIIGSLLFATMISFLILALSCEQRFKAICIKGAYVHCTVILKTSRHREAMLIQIFFSAIVPFLYALIIGYFIWIIFAGLIVIAMGQGFYYYALLSNTHKDSLYEDSEKALGGTIHTPIQS
jgi:hypothetical protein